MNKLEVEGIIIAINTLEKAKCYYGLRTELIDRLIKYYKFDKKDSAALKRWQKRKRKMNTCGEKSYG